MQGLMCPLTPGPDPRPISPQPVDCGYVTIVEPPRSIIVGPGGKAKFSCTASCAIKVTIRSVFIIYFLKPYSQKSTEHITFYYIVPQSQTKKSSTTVGTTQDCNNYIGKLILFSTF